jgi:N-acetylneuraminic acid mutarotase
MRKIEFLQTIALAILLTAFLQVNAQPEFWQSLTPIPEPRGFAASAVLDGKIYIIGGFNSTESRALSSVIAYNPKYGTYTTGIADLPFGLGNASAAVLDGKIYLTGGRRHHSLNYMSNFVYVFDPQENAWTSRAFSLRPRFNHTSVVLDGKLIIMGGRTERVVDGLDRTVEMYDPATDTWTYLASMVEETAAFTAVVYQDKIYAFGGIDKHSESETEILKCVQQYDPVKNAWSVIDEMPFGRWGHGSAVVGDEVYLFGGASWWPFPEIWTWDFTGDWLKHNTCMIDTIFSFSHGLSENNMEQPCLYAFGGVTGDYYDDLSQAPFTVATAQCFCPEIISGVGRSGSGTMAFDIYPNPVMQHAVVSFHLDKPDKIDLQITDIAGRRFSVANLNLQAGPHALDLEAGELPAGLYFCTVRTSSVSGTLPFVIIGR